MIFARRPTRYRRLLIIEDEPIVAFDAEHALIEAGHEIAATVDNIADALAVLDTGGIDLILADIRLADGETGGLIVAEQARARGVPVLFVTGSDMPPAGMSLALGVLRKPFSPSRLRAAIAALDDDGGKRRPKGLTLF